MLLMKINSQLKDQWNAVTFGIVLFLYNESPELLFYLFLLHGFLSEG